ncbi:4-hydroxy-tetrahydrodipicolinate synthase [Limnochorda pilosa]|uniref:4-hydroxy-tetrahydrodipicolinate synthase n=1 Tax=Limnochorda pilosa TaxID=1555112 RepID=A0A0K2SNH7_LIMPI|nr:4-hydroxy-tetrahydrodipicolinate synthase [Limnochorda pilosa]BAS28394.1 dihydrodipicolinate synthase [Limnochorda pilosa]
MGRTADLGRVLTALVTPMTQDGAVNLDAAVSLAHRLSENGSDGLVLCGTTGESPTLSRAEKLDLTRAVVNAVGGKATVLVGTGSYNTAESVELTREVEKLGADGILAVVPYYNKPPQEGLYRHFEAIARATALPVMLYNIPARTARNLEPETMARLAELPNVVAVKEAAGDLEQVSRLVQLLPERVRVYSGDDSLTLPMLAVGAYGVVSVASHLVGSQIQAMIQAYLEGRVEEASQLHHHLFPLFRGLFVTTNPIPVKAALELAGIPAGPPRLPLAPATEAEREAVRVAMKRVGLLD